MIYKITRKEVIQINALLSQNLIEIVSGNDKDPPIFQYAKDWDDARVARETANRMITPTHIGKLRLELFGKLKPKGNPRGSDAKPKGTQKARLLEVEQKLNKLTSAFNALCIKIGEEDAKLYEYP